MTPVLQKESTRAKLMSLAPGFIFSPLYVSGAFVLLWRPCPSCILDAMDRLKTPVGESAREQQAGNLNCASACCRFRSNRNFPGRGFILDYKTDTSWPGDTLYLSAGLFAFGAAAVVPALEPDQCKPSPCMHNGTCLRTPEGYYCDCSRTGGYQGKNCEDLVAQVLTLVGLSPTNPI